MQAASRPEHFLSNFAGKHQELKIGLYISELLQDHDYVILPGVGAFFSHYRPALVDEESEVVHPPSRDLSFSPELRNNDGLLLNHLAHREGLTAPVAHGLLENLKDELHYRLDHGETITFEHLGTLSRKEGSLQFIAGSGSEFLPDAFGMKSVQLRKVVETKEEKNISTKDNIISSSTATARKPPGRRKYLPWLLIIPVAVLAVFILYTLWNGETLKTGTKAEMAVQEIIPEPVIQQVDSVRADSLQISFEPPAPEITHPVPGLYYVIGGSFKDRENADKYCRQAISRGHEPLYLGEIGSFHVVSIGHYTTEIEAVSHQNRILRQDSTAGIWIYFSRHKED